jgi:hypothetical protein
MRSQGVPSLSPREAVRRVIEGALEPARYQAREEAAGRTVLPGEPETVAGVIAAVRSAGVTLTADDFSEPPDVQRIAREATAYRDTQAARGICISTSAAVRYVLTGESQRD